MRTKKTVQIYLEDWEKYFIEKSKTGKSIADLIEEQNK